MLQEKIDVLKVLGADVRPVPAVPFDNLENYNHQVKIIIFYTYIFLILLLLRLKDMLNH